MNVIDEYLQQARHLPPAPRLVPRLMQLLNNPDISTSKVVQLIAHDPALTASILRLCNSVYFAAVRPVADLHEGALRLGFGPIYQLLMGLVGARTLGAEQPCYGVARGRLWKHSVMTSIAAVIIGKQYGLDEHEVYTAGLLHDVGKIVLADALAGKELGREFALQLQAHPREALRIEKQVLGVTHAEVGGRLLARWRFPSNVTAAVWSHHKPSLAGPHQSLAACINLANCLAHMIESLQEQMDDAASGTNEAFIILGIPPDGLRQYATQVTAKLGHIQSLVGIMDEAATDRD